MTIHAACALLGNITVRELNRLLAAHGLPTGSPHKPVRMAAGNMTAAGERAVREILETRLTQSNSILLKVTQSPTVAAEALPQASTIAPCATDRGAEEMERLTAELCALRQATDAELARVECLLRQLTAAVVELQAGPVATVERVREQVRVPFMAYAESATGGRRH